MTLAAFIDHRASEVAIYCRGREVDEALSFAGMGHIQCVLQGDDRILKGPVLIRSRVSDMRNRCKMDNCIRSPRSDLLTEAVIVGRVNRYEIAARCLP